MFCTKCGKQNDTSAKFCANCGAKTSELEEVSPTTTPNLGAQPNMASGVDANVLPTKMKVSDQPVKKAIHPKLALLIFLLVICTPLLIAFIAGQYKEPKSNIKKDATSNWGTIGKSLNLLESAIDPKTGSKSKYDKFKDEGGINNESNFHGLSVRSFEIQYDKNGNSPTIIMRVSPTTSPKAVREALSEPCSAQEVDWTKSNVGNQSGKVSKNGIECVYVSDSEGMEVSFGPSK